MTHEQDALIPIRADISTADQAVRRLTDGGCCLHCEGGSIFLVKVETGERVEMPRADSTLHNGHAPRLAIVSSLSDRERQVFELLGAGRDMHAIAQAMNVSIKTVETYRARLKKKFGVHNRLELVTLAVEWKLTHRDAGDSALAGE
jgi:DNA-binding NarL/FixJ family response regulator